MTLIHNETGLAQLIDDVDGSLIEDSDSGLILDSGEPSFELQVDRCLELNGLGHPDCSDVYCATDAMAAVAQVLRGAIERAGRIGESIGAIEKFSDYDKKHKVWRWKVRVIVPNSITASAVELAKHLSGHGTFVGPISLVPVCGYTVH
jgi:hypothetical protein